MTQKNIFAFRGPIKYFEPVPPELGRSGDGKRTSLALGIGIFYSGLYFSFLLIKPSAVQYKLTAFHFVGALVLYLFFMFKTREHVSNHAVHM